MSPTGAETNAASPCPFDAVKSFTQKDCPPMIARPMLPRRLFSLFRVWTSMLGVM